MSQDQSPSPAPSVPSRSTEFVPVQGGEESTDAGTLLVAAYIVMWAILLGVILLTFRRQGRIDARLSEIEKTLSAAEKAHPGG